MKTTMKSLAKILLIMAMLMSLAITLSAIPTEEETQYDGEDKEDATPLVGSMRGDSRFLYKKPSGLMKCDKNPRLCRAKGSPGPDCCNKKCVNVITDQNNCGLCGRKCKNREICCKGHCVNPMTNKRHCGGCNKRCKRGDSCVYGMCNYA